MQKTTFQAPLVSTPTCQVSHFWPWKAHVLASQGPTPWTLKWAEGVMNILATRLLTVLLNGDLQICFFSPNSHPWFICTTLPQPTTRSSASNLDKKVKITLPRFFPPWVWLCAWQPPLPLECLSSSVSPCETPDESHYISCWSRNFQAPTCSSIGSNVWCWGYFQ